jgi:hypothetical protein
MRHLSAERKKLTRLPDILSLPAPLTELSFTTTSATGPCRNPVQIERVPKVWAPLEMLGSGYRLTHLGWSVLRQLDN